jgi:Ca-activated chloride channel family protein
LPDLSEHPYRPTAGAEVTTADGRSLPLVSAKLSGTAQGGIARLVLEQRFENPYAETLHVTYRMPLPADGAVSGYRFTIADRVIVARLQGRWEARAQFERAIAAGHTAALLEQERADIFTQSIGNLPANEALVARITVDQRLTWLPEGEWELRFPTVIGPRYVAATDRPAEVRAFRVTTAPEGVAARIRISVEIRDAITAGRTPASPSHALTRGDDGVALLGDIASARLDRDIVLRWPVAGPTTGISLAMTPASHPHACYGLVTIVPPAPIALGRVFPRDLIVLIDTSGSMSGPPLDKAKQVVALLIESLGDGDQLELIAFSSEPRRYKPTAVDASTGEKQAAIRWLRRLAAGGGTEMRTAVIEALHALRPGAQRQVVLVTDGYIGGETEIVRQLYAGLPASCRLHFVGVGSAVNRSLAIAMARAGRGAEVRCDLDGDAERAVKRLIDRTRSPVLTDLALEGSALLAQTPEAVPDVYAASPVVVAVKLGDGELVVRGRTHTGDWEHRLRVDPARPGAGDPAIAALFGRERVADLEARAFAGEGHDAEIALTGLEFQIATRLTSFVAVDLDSAVPSALRHEEVPQELPHGTTAAAFGLRAPGQGPEPWFRGVETLHLPSGGWTGGYFGDSTKLVTALPIEGGPTVLAGPSFDGTPETFGHTSMPPSSGSPARPSSPPAMAAWKGLVAGGPAGGIPRKAAAPGEPPLHEHKPGQSRTLLGASAPAHPGRQGLEMLGPSKYTFTPTQPGAPVPLEENKATPPATSRARANQPTTGVRIVAMLIVLALLAALAWWLVL